MNQLYNCTIEAIGSEDCGKLIGNDVISNTNEYDFGSKQYLWFASNPNGTYLNVYDLDLDFDLPGWNKAYFEQTTVRDSSGKKKNYMFDGEFNLSTYRTTWAVFVNLDMYNSNKEKWGGDEIFDLVKEGRWTIDKMMEIISKTAQDDGDQVWTASKEGQTDIFGLMTTTHNAYGLLVSVGVRTAQNNDGVLTTSQEFITRNNATEGLIKAAELTNMEGVYVGNYAINHASWNAGKSLFMGEVLNHFEAIKDMDNIFSYTVVPEPIYMETDKPVYNSYVNNKGSLYLISKNACGGNKQIISDFLNVFIYHSHHIVYPAFLEAYGEIYCDDPRSAEMLDTIVKGIIYDLSYYKGSGWQLISEMIASGNVKLGRASTQIVGGINTTIDYLVKAMDASE